jgi:hypothetical protein
MEESNVKTAFRTNMTTNSIKKQDSCVRVLFVERRRSQFISTTTTHKSKEKEKRDEGFEKEAESSKELNEIPLC